MGDYRERACPACGSLLHVDCRLVQPEPPPQPSAAPAAWALVLEDMAARDAFGARKYGVRLTPGDGRDSLKDAYQEALDLAVYLRKALYERDGR